MIERDPNADALPIGSSALRPQQPAGLRLLPARPPGRSTRKALPYVDDIRRLHALGYTLEAIREALHAVGVSVSRSTVHREVRRNSRPAAPGVVRAATPGVELAQPTPLSELPQATRVRDPPTKDTTDQLRGMEDAEAFFAAHDSNPLSRTKESS